MNTIFKKALALFALVAVALVGVVAPAYADQGTLTVTSTNAEFEGKSVSAWQMFTVTPNGSNYEYTLNDSWKEFFKQDGVLGANVSDADLNQKASDYVRNLGGNDSAEVQKFATKAYKWAKAQDIPATKTVTAAASGNSYVADFDAVDLGYYVVSPTGSKSILVNVVDKATTTNVDLKSEYPTVDKTVENETDKGNDAQIGDSVKFTLKSKVPDTSEYTNYTFKFDDTLSAGLTFNDDVAVTVGNTKLTANQFTVTPDASNAQHITIDLSGSIMSFTTGDAIVVTYSATLNENANVGNTQDKGESNSAKVVYSNDPSGTSTGESKPSTTHTYTFGFDLNKVDGDGNILGGATFQLKRQNAQGEYEVVNVIATKNSDNITAVRPAKTEETGVATFETNAAGKIAVQGLDAGTYQLVETAAPEGYNKADATEITITASYKSDGTLQNVTITNLGNNGDITIVNRKGTLLPSTGGMGTVAFTVVGAAAIIAGVAWSIRRRSHNA